MSNAPTHEQLAVVHHPRGFHARVRAVAGSGKTTTMVERVAHLVQQEGVKPQHICVLMFNRLARAQFEQKLEVTLPPELRPKVSTFHSYASRIINTSINSGLMPNISEYWIEDKEELVRMTVHRAIENLANNKVIAEDSVDIDDALECIGLWKASLIPPEHAGHKVNPSVELVYAEFEQLRLERNAVTYDDFVPIAVGILEIEHKMQAQYAGQFDTIIVDEYQDVNYGQQRLVQLLAARRADVMVVGDDDQTIYEWRGARPSYFTEHFQREFSTKPTRDYNLSTTFRFGPLLAQGAQNVIENNKTRIPKPVLAYDPTAPTTIHVYRDSSEQPTDVDKELSRQVKALARETKDASKIIVLARLFLQLTGLETQFLIDRVPYEVRGQKPFYERRENVVLFSYLHLGLDLHAPIKEDTKKRLLEIANVPNRYITKVMLERFVRTTNLPTLDGILEYLSTNRLSPATAQQREKLEDLHNILIRLHELITAATPVKAGEALLWLIHTLDLASHYDNYYGKGESSEERKGAILAISLFAGQTGKNVPDFLEYLSHLDTKQGEEDPKRIIVMTTVFREKGREYDYVILPSCIEGMMPFLVGSSSPIYDKTDQVEAMPYSPQIESERRLFYVAITRARKAVYIGTAEAPKGGRQGKSAASTPSRFIEELQLATTHAVVGAMQEYLTGPTGDMEQLITTCLHYAGQGSVVENIVNSYLPRRHIPLPDSVTAYLAQAPMRSFQYTIQYPGVAAAMWQPVVVKEPPAPDWWDMD